MPTENPLQPPDPEFNLVDCEVPEGFTRMFPTTSTAVLRLDVCTRDTIVDGYRTLLEWADEHDLTLAVYSSDRITGSSPYYRPGVPFAFQVHAPGSYSHSLYHHENNEVGWDPSVTTVQCRDCGIDSPLGTFNCPGCGAFLYCASCNAIVQLAGASGVCRRHATQCQECDGWADANQTLCHSCCPAPVNCYTCGRTIHEDDAYWAESYGGYFCDDHAPQECPRCGRHSNELDWYDEERDENVCESCWNDTEQRAAGSEEYEEEEKLEAELVLPSIPGREMIRLCGLEIEGGGNESSLGRRLYDEGLTVSRHTAGYHHASGHNELSFFSLEHDGTVDWELVSPPINLAEREDVRKLRTALRAVREEIKGGNVYLDMRCGLHIHVGAERVNIGQAYNLGTIWNYLEDMIFRLAAAKWPKHRAIVNGTGYCRPNPKGAKSKLEFGRQLDDTSDRYFGLSFNNWMTAMMRFCTCGAVRYDSWDNCNCVMRKCTFEFRVFNSSANMHKIHAYLALCQALVAKAVASDDLNADDFPQQEFVASEVGSLPTAHVDGWRERLEWMFNELPLTDAEKADLLYCVRNSELNVLGEEFIEQLAPSFETQEVTA